jgi:ADP-ribosylation factor-binding protein GGA
MSAHPKIQKMCEEESDDHEAVAKLFEINDSINRTIERYRLVKKGDLEAAAKIPKGTLGTSGAGVTRGANNELSLIDLGGPEEEAMTPAPSSSSTAEAPKSSGSALADDLLGLSMTDNYGQGGAVSLGSNGFGTVYSSINSSSDANIKIGAPPPSSGPHLSNAQITSMFNSSAPAASQPLAFSTLSNLSSPNPSSRPTSTFTSPPPQQQQFRPDPFAALSSASHTPRQQSPFQFQSSHAAPPPAAPSNLLDSFTAPPPPAQTTQAPADDEWTFASALPSSTPAKLTITNTSILISWTVSRIPSTNEIEITSNITNNTFTPISELTFQVAVTKTYSLKLEPQSGRELGPKGSKPISQVIRLSGVEAGKGESVRMRWKLSYSMGGEKKEEMGEVGGLGVS